MATIRQYKAHGTISCLPGSGRPFKLTREMVEVIEEKMKQDDETTGTQLVRVLEVRGWKISKSIVQRIRRTKG